MNPCEACKYEKECGRRFIHLCIQRTSKRDKVGDHLRHQRRHDHRPDTGRDKANFQEAANA